MECYQHIFESFWLLEWSAANSFWKAFSCSKEYYQHIFESLLLLEWNATNTFLKQATEAAGAAAAAVAIS